MDSIWIGITKCDKEDYKAPTGLQITKCDKKSLQSPDDFELQGATKWITKCDRDCKVWWHNRLSISRSLKSFI